MKKKEQKTEQTSYAPVITCVCGTVMEIKEQHEGGENRTRLKYDCKKCSNIGTVLLFGNRADVFIKNSEGALLSFYSIDTEEMQNV